jgi:enamine deaminase RidA (YjgF/YER057c/UK114 family)
MSDLTPEQKLAALGVSLPVVPTPLANYVPYRWAGNLLFLSGQGPKRPDGTFEIGRLGKSATIEDGYRAARLAIVGGRKVRGGRAVAHRGGCQNC